MHETNKNNEIFTICTNVNDINNTRQTINDIYNFFYDNDIYNYFYYSMDTLKELKIYNVIPTSHSHNNFYNKEKY